MLRTRQARRREGISGRKLCVHWFVGAVVTGISGLMLATNAAAESTAVEFNIPAQPVPSALREYARQAAVQLLASTQGLDAVQANAVVGRFDSQTALQMLLAGTGLQAEYRSDATVLIWRVTEASGRPAGSMDSEIPAYLVAQANVDDERKIIEVGNSQTNLDAALENAEKAPKEMEEIVVTGTQIRGVKAAGINVITLDREYIEQSGIPTTTELIQSVPQNFGLGANEDVSAVGIIDGPGTNFGFSSSVNLRGLGTASTLVLLNGRRSAGGGGSGNFVDLNTIPTALINRIEVLPDGASAIYGSDAVGGVINVILREDYEGAETRVRYAPGTSDIDEIQVSQVLGKKWDAGSVLFSYEYYDRSELKSGDRAYTRDSDLTSLGGGNHSIVDSNPGNILDPVTFQPAFAIPAGQDGTNLSPADLIDLSLNPDAVNLENTREGSHVLPEQRRHSVFVSVRQGLSKTIDLFAEGRFSTRDFEFLNRGQEGTFLFVPNTNAFFVDAFGGAQEYFLRYNYGADYGRVRTSGAVEARAAVLGANVTLSNSWELEMDGSYGSEDTFNRLDRLPNLALLAAALADDDPTTAYNLYGDGSFTSPATLAAIQGFADVNVDSELSTLNVRFNGDLFGLPGGAAKLAIGAQYRDQSLISNELMFTNSAEPIPGFAGSIFAIDRDISAAFAEIYLPLVADQNGRPGLKNLAVSIAGRYEDYSDFGGTFNPKLGIAWSPVESLNVRGTVGTSFRAPLLSELNTSHNLIRLFNFPDPASPTGTTRALLLTGNLPDLIPQEGTTWTVGFDVEPTSLRRFNIGLTYFSTEVDNVIQLPGNNIFAILLDPVTNGPIITSEPDVATVTALFNDPNFRGTPIPPDEVGAIIDFRVQNVANATVSGLDLNLAYAFETTAGAFSLSLYASHLFEFSQQLANGPLVDNVDTIAKPNSLNLRSALSWNAGGMNAVLTGSHIGDYTNDLGSVECSATPCAVTSWTTWDLQLGYDFSDRFSGFLDGTKLSLNVQNLFDRDPPFVDNSFQGVGFDPINANPMGRFAAIQLTKAW